MLPIVVVAFVRTTPVGLWSMKLSVSGMMTFVTYGSACAFSKSLKSVTSNSTRPSYGSVWAGASFFLSSGRVWICWRRGSAGSLS